MRVLFGMILGALLIVAVALVADKAATGRATQANSSTNIENRTMVNWDVVGENLRIVRQRVREVWTTISQSLSG